MAKLIKQILLLFPLLISGYVIAQADNIVLKDISLDKTAPAGMIELKIPSEGWLLAGMMYTPNGNTNHPTLILLHGFPGNEKNLDIAQLVRAHGWNVIYFDYRGSWGSQGKFSFKNCVQDVVNVVAFCNKYQDSLKIDSSNIVLFGHSMGAWVCLKSLGQLPQIKKAFNLSTWDISGDFQKVSNKTEMLELVNNPDFGGKHFVLNTNVEKLFTPILKDPVYFNLINDAPSLANKQIIMIDEHSNNKQIAEAIQKSNQAFFEYQVWQADHPFTNKRASLMNKIIAFLDK